jgi:hypothetical protein
VELEELAEGARSLALFELLRQRLVREVPVPNPAAGADFVATVPAGKTWELLSAFGLLTTSAAVANRDVRPRLTDPSQAVVWELPFLFDQVASSASRYGWIAGVGFAVQFGASVVGLPSPPAVLPENFSFRVSTLGLDVADQWSGVVLMVREWSMHTVIQNLDWLELRAR